MVLRQAHNSAQALLRVRAPPERGKLQFAARQIPQVASHDRIGACGDAEFDQVVVGLIRQVGSPRRERLDPATAAQKTIKKLSALGPAGMI